MDNELAVTSGYFECVIVDTIMLRGSFIYPNYASLVNHRIYSHAYICSNMLQWLISQEAGRGQATRYLGWC